MSQLTHPVETPTQPAKPAGARAELSPLVEDAVILADQWTAATEAGQTRGERRTTSQLSALVSDEDGLDLAVRFVDRVARPEDTGVAAKELSGLTSGNAASFLGPIDRSLLGIGAAAAKIAPPVVVPAARMRLRQIVGHLVVDANDPALAKHLAASRADGFRLNINLLGEAVLGEEEAASRTERTRKLLERPDVDYVSIKISSLVSQIITWDTEGTVARCVERLRPLYRKAAAKTPKAFVNLDMEEYRDLEMTIEVFETLLSEPEFHDLEAGIVLQAYLPDALPALERLIGYAQRRRAAGGAGIKIRLVKGANLAMEQVEAAVHGWAQAPYTSKEEVDANYLRCVARALRPEVADAVRLGVASHNLYDIALAHLLAERRGVGHALDVEMLQGMSPAQARAVRDTVGTVILYTPVVAPKDFDVAVSYLVRRLEENAAPENFVHAFATGGAAMKDQEARFRASVDTVDQPSVGPRRTPDPSTGTGNGTASPGNETTSPGDTDGLSHRFANTPDTDPALPENRAWASTAIATQAPPLTSPELGSIAEVDEVVARARSAYDHWRGLSAVERADLLRAAGRMMAARRPELLTVMSREAGKTIAEADPEISEAIDFALYYADRALDLESGLMADGARFTPTPITLITPPWNFPVAIPIGGVLAALAAGSAVIIKPAPQTPGCVEEAVRALHDAGIPTDVLQCVRVPENEVGRALISHPAIGTVVLTGATDTANLFAGWRADHTGGPRVFGETSGKNALVITPAADLDLAVADLVKSAFGHAGQKCSAASLAILVGSVGRSERFRRQLIDAVRSVAVDWPQNLGTTMGPIIEPPQGKLHRALTTLEPGESWLVEPRQLDDTGRLWSPGLKEGVRPGSFFHLTEVFGPVLGLMRVKTLDEALALQNAPDFGLTGGLHSLDDDEIAQWTDRVQVGNAYINRHITGAIVQRQAFGGWKASSVGPGAKAGGPNYVAQLGTWEPAGLPRIGAAIAPRVRRAVDAITEQLDLSAADLDWLEAALASDAAAWGAEFGVPQDRSALAPESNIFRYRPISRLVVRVESDGRPVEVVRLLAAAELTGTSVEVSVADGISLPEPVSVRRESSAGFATRMRAADDWPRVRVVGDGSALASDLVEPGITVLTGPVLATGRRELLSLLREQAISRTLHRFGHLPPEHR